MVSTGYKQSLFFGNETSYGSTASIDQPIGLVQSVNPTETNNLIKIRTMGGSRDYSNIIAGKFEVSGSFEYYLQGASMIRQAIGEDTGTTTTSDSGPKIHTGASYLHIMGSAAAPQTDSFPSFTLEFADDEDGGSPGTYNLIRTYSGCRVNSMTISADVDNPLKVSVDWIGQKVEIGTGAASSVTQPTTDPFIFYNGAVYSTSGTISAYTVMDKASQLCTLNSFDFTINNNLEANWYIAGTCAADENIRALKSLIPKGREYDANLTVHFKDKSQYEKFLGAVDATEPQKSLTKYEVVLDFVRSGAIGSSPKLESDDWMRIVLHNTAFDTMNITGSPEDIVSQSIGVFVESAKVYVVDSDASYK